MFGAPVQYDAWICIFRVANGLSCSTFVNTINKSEVNGLFGLYNLMY